MGLEMSKDSQKRITDTIQFIQNTNLVTLAERQAVIMFIAAHLPAPNTPQYNALSNELSLGYHFGTDTNNGRNMVRALFLIWHCIFRANGAFQMPQANAKLINQATVQDRLISYIRKVRCMQDVAGAQSILTHVFPLNPLGFLGINKVIVLGVSAFNAATAPENIQDFFFGYDPSMDRYVFQFAVMPKYFPTKVESVTAFHWTDPRHHPGVGGPLNIANTAFTQLSGIRLSGANPIITTQFTGCAFCMAEYNGDMYCAHVSPAGVKDMAPNTQGDILAKRIMDHNNGQFSNAGGTNVTVFGRDKGHAPNPGGYSLPGGGGNGNYMTIVGFPAGTSYQLYSQTTMNNQISGNPVRII